MSHSMPRRILALPLFAPVFATADAAAQVRGSVVDGSGNAVPAATVELWSGLRRVRETRTDSQGGFRLETDGASPPTGVFVRRIGFENGSLAIRGDTSVVIALRSAALQLSGIVVAAERRVCPNREDPAARTLWEAMRARYPAHAGTVYYHSFGTLVRATVPLEKIDEVGEAEPQERTWQYSGTPTWGVWRDIIARDGYATRINGGMGEAYASWFYAPLQLAIAQHFVEPQFAELHTIGIVSTVGGDTLLGFCSRPGMARSRTRLEGTLTLSPARELIRARWRYRTPGLNEDAGSEVEFLPPGILSGALLLPRSYRYWRRTNGGRFFVQQQTFSEWRISPDGRPPVMPAQRNDE
ncbi:MAG TPA: carboxypeptidase-like regulatory domain-containing protein [Longimicrobium sp.]|nr:carboxypeptidase-like regulatory domain-containing protein [Longimicrobium sp.]